MQEELLNNIYNYLLIDISNFMVYKVNTNKRSGDKNEKS